MFIKTRHASKIFLLPRNSPIKNQYLTKNNYCEIECILISLLQKLQRQQAKHGSSVLFFFVEVFEKGSI